MPKGQLHSGKEHLARQSKTGKTRVEGPEDRKGDLAGKTPHIEYSLGVSVITERLYIDGKQDLKIKKSTLNSTRHSFHAFSSSSSSSSLINNHFADANANPVVLISSLSDAPISDQELYNSAAAAGVADWTAEMVIISILQPQNVDLLHRIRRLRGFGWSELFPFPALVWLGPRRRNEEGRVMLFFFFLGGGENSDGMLYYHV